MKPLVVNVRGTSGSGKTTLTRDFMKTLSKLKERTTDPLSPSKITGYTGFTSLSRGGVPWFVVGSYENVCGGCDTIKTQAQIIERVQWGVDNGYNVWLEGLILSTIYGSVGAYSEWFGDRWLFAYLNTPPEVCVERVIARRALAGNIKPFDTENTVKRCATIERNRVIVESKGRVAVTIDYKRPLASMQAHLRRFT